MTKQDMLIDGIIKMLTNEGFDFKLTKRKGYAKIKIDISSNNKNYITFEINGSKFKFYDNPVIEMDDDYMDIVERKEIINNELEIDIKDINEITIQ